MRKRLLAAVSVVGNPSLAGNFVGNVDRCEVSAVGIFEPNGQLGWVELAYAEEQRVAMEPMFSYV